MSAGERRGVCVRCRRVVAITRRGAAWSHGWSQNPQRGLLDDPALERCPGSGREVIIGWNLTEIERQSLAADFRSMRSELAERRETVLAILDLKERFGKGRR